MVRASRGFEVVMLVITMILLMISCWGSSVFWGPALSAHGPDNPTGDVTVEKEDTGRTIGDVEVLYRDDRCPPPSETPRHTYSGRLDEFVFAPKTEQIKAILGECVYNKLYKGANNSKIKGGK